MSIDPTKVSPSRVNKLSECGIAFKRHYIDREPGTRLSSYALFGSVVHRALEDWSKDRQQPLFGIMQDAWETCTQDAPVIMEFLKKYRAISTDVIRAEHAAREAFNTNPLNVKAGKTSQSPRMTKHFKESPAAKSLYTLMREWEPKLNAGSKYEFGERDPLSGFYDESLVLAKRYEKQYAHLPDPLYVELEVNEPWRGFTLHGYIDLVELLIHPSSGEVQGIGVIDYKTYRREPSEHKDYRQIVMYAAAVGSMVARGALSLPANVPVYVGVDYVMFAGVENDWLPSGSSRRFWSVGPEDFARLERELTAFKSTVAAEAFLPAPKGSNPDYCEYGETCCLRSTAAAGGSAALVSVTL